MSESTTKELMTRFVYGKIMRLDADTSAARAGRAKLRRGIGSRPGALPEIWELTLAEAPEDWYSGGDEPSRQENAVHTALTLYALHRQGKDASMNASGKGFSLGGAAAELVNRDENRYDAVKRRFDAVATSTEFTELANHARGIVQLLKAEDIRMDYPRFAYDLFVFQFPESADSVRRHWGEDFYRKLNYKGDSENK